jgi:hypothetical protein
MARTVVSMCMLFALVVGAGWCKDIVSMPETDMMGQGEVEMAYIYWDLEDIHLPNGTIGRDYAHVFETFIGITDRVELDLIHIDLQGHFETPLGDPLADKTELNLYVKALRETEKLPAITIGATNITSNDWLPSSEKKGVDGDYRVSPLIVLAKTIRPPKNGPPAWNDPAIRLQLGYGTNFHEEHPFGILQFAFTPNLVAGYQHYQHKPGWLIGWNQPPWGIHVGGLSGDNWIHVNYDIKLNSLF